MKSLQRAVSDYAIFGVASALLLAGCSSPSTGGGGTDGSGQSGSSGQGNGTTTETFESDTGGFEGVPATFPTDVPIIDGDVPLGVDLGTGWTVIVVVDDIAAAYAEASAKLTGAGYAAVQETTSDDGSFGAFQNDKYQVQITAADTPDYGATVTYVVVLAG